MQTISQTTQIKKHLEKGKAITQLDALRRFGCLRLGARILELKRDGEAIYTRMVNKNGKRVAEYSAVPFKSVVLLSVDMDQKIGDMELLWIIYSGLFLVCFWAISFAIIIRRHRAERRRYPSARQVKQADDKQIAWWVKYLPLPSTDEEMKVIDLIVRRYIGVETDETGEPSELHAADRYAVTDECFIASDF